MLDFTKTVKGFGGQPIRNETRDDKGEITANTVTFAEILGKQLFYAGADNTAFQNGGNSPLSDDEKMRAYHLSVQMSEHPDKVEVSSADGVLIEKIASKCFVAGIYGQIYDHIERK